MDVTRCELCGLPVRKKYVAADYCRAHRWCAQRMWTLILNPRVWYRYSQWPQGKRRPGLARLVWWWLVSRKRYQPEHG